MEDQKLLFSICPLPLALFNVGYFKNVKVWGVRRNFVVRCSIMTTFCELIDSDKFSSTS